MTPLPLDLFHGDVAQNVCCYVIETADGHALFDCGPTTCLPALKRGLAERGLGLHEIRHLILSHIHFDHAGATGALVREHPELEVHVSAIGAPHLVDPARLEASARRLYGDTFDALWGELVPVPAANIRIAGDSVVGLECFPSPGHASHHISIQHEDGTLYAGDSLGIRVAPSTFVVAPTPPPDVDLEAWEETVIATERHGPSRLALTHFGVFDDVSEHLAGFRETLARWADRVAHGMDEATFVAAASADYRAADPGEIEPHDLLAQYVPCFLGLERYWQKRAEATQAR